MKPLDQVIKALPVRWSQSYSAMPVSDPEKTQRGCSSDQDTLDGQEEEAQAMLSGGYPVLRLRRGFGCLHMAVAVFSFLSLGILSGFLLARSWPPLDVDARCMRHTSTYSTVMNQISNKLHDVKFNGTLGKNSEFSGHWGDPNEEMDRNWNKWGFGKFGSFSEQEFAEMGMDLEGSAKFTPEFGGGHIGFLEVSHQMHCLNVIRQAYHREYYEKPENKIWADWLNDNPITIKVHISHCFEMLRQVIMCNADLGLIPQHWVEDIKDPFANFNTVHKCRDLDSIERWIEDHVVPPVPATGFPMPTGSKVWPRPT
ncbi:protein of unknown function (DUF3328) domain containing protein [Rhypophila sp. PSN 637]